MMKLCRQDLFCQRNIKHVKMKALEPVRSLFDLFLTDGQAKAMQNND